MLIYNFLTRHLHNNQIILGNFEGHMDSIIGFELKRLFKLDSKNSNLYNELQSLKGQYREDFAVLGQF